MARKMAVDVLFEIMENKISLDEAKKNQKAENEKFVNMLLYAALRKNQFVLSILRRYIKKKIAKKHIYVQYCLVCAVCEIFYMNSPAYAVINEYVRIAKEKSDRFLAAMANAVLRKIAAQKDELLKLDEKKDFPQDFKKILEKDYTLEEVQAIEETYEKRPALDISLKDDTGALNDMKNFEVLDKTSIRINDYDDVRKISGYNEGKWWVQDYAASLAVKLFDDLRGKNVLDLCAAPGGKTAQLASLGAKVLAVDVSNERLERLKENMQRLNFEVETKCADALDFLCSLKGDEFDAILVDAPCSATGTFRRHPEIPYIKTADDVKKMAQVQEKFLAASADKLKKGGELVYCVCSIFKDEGEKIAEEFLQKNKNFVLEKPKSDFADKRIITKEGYVRTLPFYASGMDGFFAVKMKKI